MFFRTYQRYAWGTNKTREDERFFHMQMGFSSEGANICNLVKEARREQNFDQDVILNHTKLNEEIGDTLWYLSALHTVAGKNFGDALGMSNFEELDTWAKERPAAKQIKATQNLYSSHTKLAGQIDHLKQYFPANAANDYLKNLAQFAHVCGTSLNEAADHNLQKISDRYAQPEQLHWPDAHEFAFMGRKAFDFSINGDTVTMSSDGKIIGDPLTSQVREDDGFNTHDIVHLSLATYLDWSPVLRKLTNTRRDDDTLDGARHYLTEENIVQNVWRFQEENPNRHGLGWDLLTNISDSVAKHPEANKITLAQWENAIKIGVDNANKLAANKGGRVVCDFVSKQMTLNLVA